MYAEDISKLNKSHVDNIFYIRTINDLIDIMNNASANNKTIAMRGQKHTMGGQTISKNYIIDMKFFNKIIDITPKYVIVQSGILWSDLLFSLNNFGLSPMTLQSYSSFSVGGSISVNAHGITNNDCLCNSIIEMKIMLSNGKIIMCSEIKNSQLFGLVIGGYGLFGVILEVMLKIVPNTKLRLIYNKYENISTFYDEYMKTINTPNIDVKLARLNILNFNEIQFFKFVETKKYIVSKLDYNPNEMSILSKILYKWILSTKIGKKLRYMIEDANQKPIDANIDTERNSFLYDSADSLAILYNPLIDTNETHILQEFFVPNDKIKFQKWMIFLKTTFSEALQSKTTISLLNCTIRYVLKDTITFLKYAKQDSFAFVFYYRMNADITSDNDIRDLHNILTNKVIELEGSFYLPYRHHYSMTQLRNSYPEIGDFFKLKHKYDPFNRFTNLWYYRYCPPMNFNYGTNKLQKYITKKNYTTEKKYNSDTTSHYKTIIANKYLKVKFEEYIDNILPAYESDYIIRLISDVPKNENTDQHVHEYIKKKVNSLMFHKYKLYNLTTYLEKNIGQLLVALLEGSTFERCLFFDNSKLYIDILKSNKIIGDNNYIIREQKDLVKYSNGSLFDSVEYLGGENKLDCIYVLDGLHNFDEQYIDTLLTFFYKILIPGGTIILRENDADNENIPLIYCAYNLFDAYVGGNEDSKKNIDKNFKSVDEWTNLMDKYGFSHNIKYQKQPHDTTDNMLTMYISNKKKM